MANPRQQVFLDQIQANSGIIHKVIRLYVDDSEDRRDLYQEIVCQAWSSYANFAGKSKFSTWLYRVALNTTLTFRKKSHGQKQSTELKEGDHPAERPSATFEMRELLTWAMRKLNEVDRMIILLHLEGYNNEEISGITGLNKNHLGVKLHRIKSKLTEILEPYRYGPEGTVE